MRGNWIKVVLFILAMIMVVGVMQVMLDPGLGKPDEARRVKHPAGFSFIPPAGWGGSVFYAGNPRDSNTLRVSPEQSTGRQPVIGVSRYEIAPEPAKEAQPFTFQGQPARKTISESRRSWTWRIDFVRDNAAYSIAVTYANPTDVEKGPLWPFIETFKVEPVIDFKPMLGSPTLPIATTSPTTIPENGAGSR